MFCMYCGKQIPDDVKYCIYCGENQSTDTDKANLLKERLVPALCPNCGGQMKVDPEKETAACNHCGTVCLVNSAIETLKMKGSVNAAYAEIQFDDNLKGKMEHLRVMLQFGEFEKAKERCENLLKNYPTNGMLYLYRLMIEYNCRTYEDLCRLGVPVEHDEYYEKAISYGDGEAKRMLLECTETIQRRIAGSKAENEKARTEHANRNTCNPEAEIKNLSGITKGTMFIYGSLENKPLYWLALEADDEKIGALSYGFVPDYKARKKVTCKWENSSLRKYLNGAFLKDAFTPQQRAKLREFSVHTEPNPKYKAKPGKDTMDFVTLFSVEDCEKYAEELSRAKAEKGWILRTPGEFDGQVVLFYSSNDIASFSRNVDSEMYIRPFMWISK